MNYHNISYPDQNNGDGLRVVLWLSGCSHKCYNCQNPQTWDINGGIEFDDDAKAELFRELEKDYISGLTLSGGDPLTAGNVENTSKIVNETRVSFPNKSIWLYTGYTWEEILNNDKLLEVVSKCDVLVDGRYVDALRDVTLHWRGSSNQRVINVQQSLQKGEVILWCQ